MSAWTEVIDNVVLFGVLRDEPDPETDVCVANCVNCNLICDNRRED